MDAPEYLIEVDAHDGTSVTTLRYSMSGYRTGPGDTPANTLYAAVVRDPGTFDQGLFGDKKTMGQSQVGFGAIVLVNADGALDALLHYGFDGRAVVVKRLASIRAAFSSATVILRGTVERLDTDAASTELRLRLYDRRLELDKPVQTNRYGGTTTSGGLTGHLADGTADMKDQTKPLVFGRVFNIVPVTVNPFDLIYQINDGAVTSIVVCDGQVPLASTGDYATVALLQAAHIPPGKVGTCLALGLFRLGVATWFQMTADVVEGATLSVRCAGAVVQRILSKMGITDIDASSFTALNSAAAQELGIFVTGDQTGSDAIGQVLSSIGGYIVPNASGLYQVGRAPVLTTSSWAANENLIEGDLSIVANPDTDHGLPAWRVILRYGRSYTVQEGESICPGAAADRRGFAAAALREIKSEDASIKTKYVLAPELAIDTLLTDPTDAAAEAARRFGLYSVPRDVVTMPVGQADADAMTLGSTGTLTHGRFGWGAGKDFVVLERDSNPAAEQVTLTLWG